jgi:hypothetical protein
MRYALPSALIGAHATITSSTTVESQYPLAHLHDGLPTEIVRWETSAPTRIVWDFGVPVTIEGLLVVMHTFAAGAVLKVQAHTADSWGAPAFSQDVTVPTWLDHVSPNVLADLRGTALAASGFRYVSLLMPAQAANHAIGELLWVATWSETDSAPAWPVDRRERRRVSVNTTAYGVEHIVERNVRQTGVQPVFRAISDADRGRLLALARAAGAHRGWVLVIEYGDTPTILEALYVRFTPEMITQLTESFLVFGAHEVQLDLLEVQRGLAL